MISKKHRFEVYLLDGFMDDGVWQENERYYLGDLEIQPAVGGRIDDEDVLQAMRSFVYTDYAGRGIRALSTSDRRSIYAVDLNENGSWWEIGLKKGKIPLYGLKEKDDAA